MKRRKHLTFASVCLSTSIAKGTALILSFVSFFAQATASNTSPTLPKKLTFSTSSHAAVVHYYQPLIQAAYKKLGIDIEFLQLNEDRSVRLLDQGMLDGDTVRTESIHKTDSHFVPVKLLGEAKVYLVCRPEVKCNADLLKQPNYSLGSVGGSSHFDELLKSSEIIQLRYTNYDLLRNSFKQGKIDAYIEVMSAHYHPQRLPENATSTYLETIRGFHYLHETHANLAPMISEAISALQAHIHKEDDSCWQAFETPAP